MILKEHIEEIATAALEGSDMFLTDVKVTSGNIITVTIDSETSLTIEDCRTLSRGIEKQLDRDEEDFELRVTSYGADNPLKFHRQYKKNIGRRLEITFQDDTKQEVKLTGVIESGIEAEQKEGTKKNSPTIAKTILFTDIQEARVIISFK